VFNILLKNSILIIYKMSTETTWINSILGLIDDGPETCIFEKIINSDNDSLLSFSNDSGKKITPSYCKKIHNMAKYTAKTHVQPDRKIRYCLALAAFAQFHFVDIHPFNDGNDRMCRFISKHILDWVLPVPFPMFVDRDKYLMALEVGRNNCYPKSSKR
jgi:hypothetical protein